MPGGFVRIADSADARAVSLQHGAAHRRCLGAVGRPGRPRPRCCRPPERIAIQRASGVLPSRAADNLFWVGRYVERAEATLRLVRALINRITEADEASGRSLADSATLLEAWSAGPTTSRRAKPRLIARAALTAATSTARCRSWPAPRGPRPR